MYRRKRKKIKLMIALIVISVVAGGGYIALNINNKANACGSLSSIIRNIVGKKGKSSDNGDLKSKSKFSDNKTGKASNNKWWEELYTMKPDVEYKKTTNKATQTKDTSGDETAVSTKDTSSTKDSDSTTKDSDSKTGTSGLMTAPLAQFNATTKSKGNVKALIVKVDFSDIKYAKDALSGDNLKEAVFGNENKKSEFYPLESVKAFYKRASYNNVNIDGDVTSYTAKNPRAYYKNKNEYETLAMEVLSAIDSKINFADYDVDKDGYIDCLTISVPTNGTGDDEFWHSCQATWHKNQGFSLDGKKIKGYVVCNEQPRASSINRYNSTLTHEFGHLMGLPDYYKYNTNNWQGMEGTAGYEKMDDCIGDFGTFSKIMFGWAKPSNIKVASLKSGSETFSIAPSSGEHAECVIVPVGKLDKDYFSEYFLIEYQKAENNNAKVYQDEGVRVLHVNATAMKSIYNPNFKMFKYENFSNQYDKSNNGIRILKLVNDNKGFYKKGSTIKYGTSNFATYDQSGRASGNPGFSISVGDLSNGKYNITISK